MPSKTRVIIDTDPGVDDAIAILFAAASPEVEILGCTTVIGNTPAAKGARNALALLQLIGRDDIPVAIGIDRPIVHPRRDFVARPSKVHGDSGLGSLKLPEPKRAAEPLHAVHFLADTIREYDGALTIAAIGPLTNLAMLSILYPDEFAQVERVVVMGGSQREAGNHSGAAEYNFYTDPVAAQCVIATAPNLHLLPLDITHQAVLTGEDVAELKAMSGGTAAAAAELLDFYETWHLETYGTSRLPMHDSLALVAITSPELISWVPATVRVGFDEGFLRGVSIIDRHNFDAPANALIGDGIDETAFRRLLVRRLGGSE